MLQVKPRLVDRLVNTLTVLPLIPREEINHTLCRASNAIEGSLACP